MGRTQREIMDHMKQTHDEGEPIHEAQRSVIRAGESDYVNPTKLGSDILDLTPGDDVTVRVYEDRVVIRSTE